MDSESVNSQRQLVAMPASSGESLNVSSTGSPTLPTGPAGLPLKWKKKNSSCPYACTLNPSPRPKRKKITGDAQRSKCCFFPPKAVIKKRANNQARDLSAHAGFSSSCARDQQMPACTGACMRALCAWARGSFPARPCARGADVLHMLYAGTAGLPSMCRVPPST